MAAACEVCGKKRVVGHMVSHSNHKTKRFFRPNLKSVKAIDNKSPRRMTVCTRCIRSGWVKKAV